MSKEEIWKYVECEGFENQYKISNFGNVISNHCRGASYIGKKLKPFKVGKYRNYLTVRLYGVNKKRDFKVHRLVAEHFIDNPKNLPQVNHIDGNTYNNHIENLEWCDNSQNQIHAWQHGLNHTTENTYKALEELKIINNITIMRPIVQFDFDYNFINYYGSLSRAEKLVNNAHISNTCNLERYYAGGYKWRYINECQMKNKVIVISGKSAVGKNYIVEKLKNVGLNEFVSYTTRPMREGESQGIQYYFINNENIKNLNQNCELLEVRKYKTEYGNWYYGLGINEIKKDNGVCILDLKGLRQLKDKIGKQNIMSIYIDADRNIRYKRAMNRDNLDDNKINEIERRFISDELDFPEEDIKNEYDYVFLNNNEDDSNIIVNKILNMMKTNDFCNKRIEPLNFKKGEIKYNNKYFYELKELCNYLGLKYGSMQYFMNKKGYTLEQAIEYSKLIDKYKKIGRIVKCNENDEIFFNYTNIKQAINERLNINISSRSIYEYFKYNLKDLHGLTFYELSFQEYYNKYIKNNIDYELKIY